MVLSSKPTVMALLALAPTGGKIVVVHSSANIGAEERKSKRFSKADLTGINPFSVFFLSPLTRLKRHIGKVCEDKSTSTVSGP